MMFADNHHDDGRVAVWLPVPPGMQEALISENPDTFFRPPYVGHRGWIGLELNDADDALLDAHVQLAWEQIAPGKLLKEVSGG